MRVEDKLGRFAILADSLTLTDEAGNPVTTTEAGKTVVHGPFRLVTKDQTARVTGIVTESMLNATDKDTGESLYEFEGYGWRPQAAVGDILMQDVNNLPDRWSCKPGLFKDWNGTVGADLSVTYSKAGKPLLALEIPEGTPIVTLEGPRSAPAGCLLVFTNANKGDFYVWTADVVAAYVRDYVG